MTRVGLGCLVLILLAACEKSESGEHRTATPILVNQCNGAPDLDAPSLSTHVLAGGDKYGFSVSENDTNQILGVYDYGLFAAQRKDDWSDVADIATVLVWADGVMSTRDAVNIVQWAPTCTNIELGWAYAYGADPDAGVEVSALDKLVSELPLRRVALFGNWVTDSHLTKCLQGTSLSILLAARTDHLRGDKVRGVERSNIDILVLTECPNVMLRELFTRLSQCAFRHISISGCGSITEEELELICSHQGVESIEVDLSALESVEALGVSTKIHTVSFSSVVKDPGRLGPILGNTSIVRVGNVSRNVKNFIQSHRPDMLVYQTKIVSAPSDISLPKVTGTPSGD